MFYKILKWLLFLTSKAYFRSITIKKIDDFHHKGPIIYAANHPSAFMDPIILAVHLKKPVYFLVRGDLFKNKIIRRILHTLHMIPVYKSDLSPNQMHKNEAVFEKCFEHLGKNKSLMIFPEGVSKTERRLRPIKTGLARIALGAEAKYNFNLNVIIIPIGINYSNPHNFKSDVFVNIGTPIKVKDYANSYSKDNKKSARLLTDKIKIELEKQLIIIEDEQFDKIINQVEVLYRNKLRDKNKDESKASQDFHLSQDIVKAVDYYAKYHPEILNDFKFNINEYLKRIDELNIKDIHLRSSSLNFNLIKTLLIALLTCPIFIYGFIFNIIPFKISQIILRRINVREDFQGSINMSVGFIIFLSSYLVQTIYLYQLSSIWLSSVFLFSFYPSGLFSLLYLKRFYQIREKFNYFRLYVKKSDLIVDLKIQRQHLIDTLENAKMKYLEEINQ